MNSDQVTENQRGAHTYMCCFWASNCVPPIVAIFQGISFIGNQGLLVARTYAVAQGSRIVFALVSTLSLLNLGAILVEDVSQSCSGTFRLTMKAVFYYTRRGFIERKLLCANTESLSSLLLRQGIHRYVVIFTWTLIDVVGAQESAAVDYTLIPINTLTIEIFRNIIIIVQTFFRQGADAPLENAITTILICRIILEMREFAIRRMTIPTILVKESI
ncbi:hypothetical protein BU17DRAFT_63543 [Hysterangium stoloniferum]|nr:hypothetical protein BU17DRAFT_63543 [Hysterangium stoloniferum]